MSDFGHDSIAELKRGMARLGRSVEDEDRDSFVRSIASEIEVSFETLAAELRELTAGRKQTPSEVLLREGRGERDTALAVGRNQT
jgi:plasmid stability protein